MTRRKYTAAQEAVFRKMVSRVLSRYGVEVNRLSPDREASFQCPYGRVVYTIYSDWVHFYLTDFAAPYPKGWYGFTHWKFNYQSGLTSGRRNMKMVEREFDLHVRHMFRDNGFGFPLLPQPRSHLRDRLSRIG